MDFTPLQQLRERLKTGAIAGTTLLSEDFRLTRALEAFAPLEAASPVFAKIGQGVRGLLSPDCKDPGAALLDVLALVDAVLVTQSVTAVAEAPKPLTLYGEGASVVQNVPYSRLAQLIDSLTTSGGGRYTYVEETHQEKPELFEDYRVKQAMVKALGGTYAELAERVADWLSAGDASIIPLLQHEFDPKGKREMVRRLNVMEAVAGARVNDFYLSLLEDSEKDVRAAAVYALRHSPENIERLLVLAKTEKGNAKKQAHWALSQLESPEVEAYWEQLVAKKPQEAGAYLQLSKTAHTSRMVGEKLVSMVAPFEAGTGEIDKNFQTQISNLMDSLPGKSGVEICEFYRRAAALGEALDKPLPGEKEPFAINTYTPSYGKNPSFSQAVPSLLFDSLIYNPTADLLALADELGEKYGGMWGAARLVASLLTDDGEAAWEIGKKYIETSFGKQRNKENREILNWTLGNVSWNREKKKLMISRSFYDPRMECSRQVSQPLRAPLDLRWYQALAKEKGSSDDFMMKLIQLNDPEITGFLCEYFYNRGLAERENIKYIRVLKTMGYNRCTGLGIRFCEGRTRNNWWQVQSMIESLPGNEEGRKNELLELIACADKGKILFSTGDASVQLRDVYKKLFGEMK